MLDAITQYILALVPAVTALVGMAVCVGVGVGKIRKANSETSSKVEEVSQNDRLLKKQLREVSKENAELKKQLNEVMARMKHMYFIEKDSKEE